jgi:hypothetical protein
MVNYRHSGWYCSKLSVFTVLRKVHISVIFLSPFP